MNNTLKLIGIVILALIGIKLGMFVIGLVLNLVVKVAIVALFVGGALYLISKLSGASRSLNSSGRSLP